MIQRYRSDTHIITSQDRSRPSIKMFMQANGSLRLEQASSYLVLSPDERIHVLNAWRELAPEGTDQDDTPELGSLYKSGDA